MCSDKKLVKGVIDPISIIGVLFLVATLTLGINTVRNKNIQLKTEREASSCFDECRKESGTQVCNCRCYGQCTRPDSHTDPEAAERWNITPPPANPVIDRTTNSTCPTGYIACGGEGLAFNFCLKADLGKSCNQSAQEQGYTVPTSNITCNAQNINTVAVGSNNQFLRCDGTQWTTQCNDGKDCAIEDLTIIPTHLQQQYDQAILAQTQQAQNDQNQTGGTKPDYSPTQNESTETSASQSTYTNSSCNSQCKFNESCVHIGYGYYGCQTTSTVRSVGEKQCNGNNLETWNGTRWEARYCEFGCLNGGCVARVQANIEVNRDDNGVTRDLTYLYRDAEQNIQEQKKQNGDLCSYNGECESNKCAQTGTPVKRCVANMTQLEQVYSGLNTITLGTFGDYVSAFQQPRPTREQTNERIQACIDSGQSAYYCMRQATSLTPEQVGSSVALGTVITTELALLGTGFNYAVGASTGTAAMTNAMTAASLYQSGRAVDFCVNNPNSTECYLETVYAVTSIANVGSAANLARATGSAIQTARLINTGINVLNLGVDAIDVTMNCLGENRNGLGCGIAIGATVLDIGGGVLDIGDIVSDFKYGLQGLDSNLGAWPVGKTFQPVNNAFDNIINPNSITGNPIPTTLDTALLPQIPQGINIQESGGLNLSTFLPAPLGSGDNILPIINRHPATIQGQTALMNESFPATRPQLDPETIIRGGIPVIPSDLGTPFNPNHLKVAWDFKMPKDFAIQPRLLPEDDPLRTLYTNQGIVPDEAIQRHLDTALHPQTQSGTGPQVQIMTNQHQSNYRVYPIHEPSGLADNSGGITNRVAVSEMEPPSADGNKLIIYVDGFNQMTKNPGSIPLELAQKFNARTISTSILNIPTSYSPPSKGLDIDADLILAALDSHGVKQLPDHIIVVGYSEGSQVAHNLGAKIAQKKSSAIVETVTVTGFGLTDVAGSPLEFVKNFILEVGHIGANIVFPANLKYIENPINATIESLKNLSRIIKRVQPVNLLGDILTGNITPRVEQIRKIYQANPTVGSLNPNHKIVYIIPENDWAAPINKIRSAISDRHPEGTVISILPGANHQYPVTNPSAFVDRIQLILNNESTIPLGGLTEIGLPKQTNTTIRPIPETGGGKFRIELPQRIQNWWDDTFGGFFGGSGSPSVNPVADEVFERLNMDGLKLSEESLNIPNIAEGFNARNYVFRKTDITDIVTDTKTGIVHDSYEILLDRVKTRVGLGETPLEAVNNVLLEAKNFGNDAIDLDEVSFLFIDKNSISSRILCHSPVDCLETPILQQFLLSDLGVTDTAVLIGFGGTRGKEDFPFRHGALVIEDQIVGYNLISRSQDVFQRYANIMQWGDFFLTQNGAQKYMTMIDKAMEFYKTIKN